MRVGVCVGIGKCVGVYFVCVCIGTRRYRCVCRYRCV